MTAALTIKHDLGDDVDVTVISKSDQFQFNPSLIWIPFGKRTVGNVTFPVARTFESHGVEFVHGEATQIDADAQRVETSQGARVYDYLVIATGYENEFDVVPGIGPGGNAYWITDLDGAVGAAEGWARFLNDPGPVVVAATQGAACFGAAYEFVFNVAYQLKKHKLKVPLSYVSAEPFPGHFGIGGLPGGETLLGMFFKRQKIEGIFDVATDEVAPGEIVLADGRTLPFKYAMVVPPFVGADVVKRRQARLREVLPLEDAQRLREAALIRPLGVAHTRRAAPCSRSVPATPFSARRRHACAARSGCGCSTRPGSGRRRTA